MPQTKPFALIFSDSQVLSDSLLEGFLHENVKALHFKNCQEIKNSTIRMIQEKCPCLKIFSLTGCPKLTDISSQFLSSPLDFQPSKSCIFQIALTSPL